MKDEVFKILKKMEIVFFVTLAVSATLIMFTNAVSRYLFSFTIVWAEEVIRIIFVWSMFAAVTTSFIRNEHIGFELLYQKYPFFKNLFKILYPLILLFVGFVLAVYGYKYNKFTGAVPLAATGLYSAVFMIPGILAGIVWSVFGIVRLIKTIFSFTVKNKNNKE